MTSAAPQKHIVSVVALLVLVTATAAYAVQDFRDRITTTRVATLDSITADVEAEIEFGRDVAAKILGRYRRYDDATLNRYVNLIGRAVAQNSTRPELTFRFTVVNTDEINAYAAPGGYIFLTHGALQLMDDESELAGVLAHEVAHVSQKHIVKELDIKGFEKDSEVGLSRFLGGASDPARVAFAQAVNKAVEILFSEGLKKDDEYEADRVGTLLATETGYDPTALNRYLGRVQRIKGDKTAILSHTHPPFDQRIIRISALLKEEQLDRMNAPKVKKRFVQYTR